MNNRLSYVDGLRACAALCVVVGHTVIETGMKRELGIHWYSFFSAAVSFFIVISGFCLTLPVQGKDLDPIRFFRRRARRILPPYYAALALSALLIWFHPARTPTTYFWQITDSARGVWPTVAHILLIHNLSTSWAHAFDFPMWSIATEWQIYFFFPLFIWARRRGSELTPVVLAFLLGAVGTYLVTGMNHGVDPARLHLFGLFGLGMLATEGKPVDRYPWRFLALAAICAAAYVGVTGLVGFEQTHASIVSILGGFVAYFVLRDCGQPGSVLRRALEVPLLVWIGGFSYSLYLMHVPILAAVHLFVPDIALAGVPVSIAGAYLFYLVFERPFLNSQPSAGAVKRQLEAPTLTAVDTAPAPSPAQPAVTVGETI